MNLWPERAWWHDPGKTWLEQQPIAHLIGGMLWASFAMVLWWPTARWQPIVFVSGMTFYWQLRVWEPESDGTYPFHWVIYDVIVAALAAGVVVGLRILVV